MKHIQIILGLILFASVSTFAQSPRIKLNQITKDTVKGSVLISSPTDSGMVYSRDFYIAYGADTVLILGGDTLAKTSGIISSVLSDNVTITGDGTVGSPLKVDTATVVASVGRLLDSLINIRTDLDLKQAQLNGTGFVKATGTTITYDNSTYLTTEVDGSVTNEIQDISTSGAAGNISISSGSTLNLNVDDADASATNEGSLTVGAGGANDAVISSNTSGSSDVTISGGTNVTVTESGQTITIASSGGAIPVDTFVTIAGTDTITGAKTFTSDLNVDAKIELNDGGNSVFIGDDAGRVDDGTDNRNVGIGYQALYNNTSGYNNVANGYRALFLNTTGYQNIANGRDALRLNTTGYNNIANGVSALFSLSSGNNNQAYGYQAGRYLSDGSTALTTANGSLFLGSNTKASANGNSNEIVIGTNAIGNGSNTITIGSSSTQSLHTGNYEFDIDQTVGASEDNYVLIYDNGDGQISLEPISLSGSATLDFGSTSAQSSSDLTITVTGAADGDVVSLGVPNASVNANTNYTAWVSAANTVTVRFNNYSSGSVDPASGTFKVKVFK